MKQTHIISWELFNVCYCVVRVTTHYYICSSSPQASLKAREKPLLLIAFKYIFSAVSKSAFDEQGKPK